MPRAATLYQIQRYGEVASTLRRAMKAKGMNRTALAQELGLSKITQVSLWINALGAPPASFRERLAKVLEVPAESLVPRPAPMREQGSVVEAPPPPAQQRPVVLTELGPADVLTFSLATDGLARIRLDVVLPIDQAFPLMRLLMDQELERGAKEDRRHD